MNEATVKRVMDLQRRGKTAREISSIVGISVDDVKVMIRDDAADAQARAAVGAQVPKTTAIVADSRPVAMREKAQLPSWTDKDYIDFAVWWNAESNGDVRKASDAYGISEKHVKYVVNRLRAGGVELVYAHRKALDFAGIAAAASKALTDDKRAAIKAKKEMCIERMKKKGIGPGRKKKT